MMVDWTTENIATLKSMWRAGDKVALIAKAIPGATRNAVIGKAHRLKLGLHPLAKKLQLQPPNGDKHPPAAARRVA